MDIEQFKEGFSELVQICLDIPSVTLQNATLAIDEEMATLQKEDASEALTLLAELLVHVNDLDQEEADEYQDVLLEINERADELRSEFI